MPRPTSHRDPVPDARARPRRRHRGVTILAGILATVSAWGPVQAVHAQDDGPDGPEVGADGGGFPDDTAPRHLREPAPVVIVDDPRIDPALGAVRLESADYDLAVAAYLTTQQVRDQAADAFNRSVAELKDLLAARTRLGSERNVAIRRKAKSAARLAELRDDLKGVAVDGYLRGGLGGPAEGSFDVDEALSIGRRRVYIGTVHGDQLAEQRLNVAVVDEMTGVLAQTEAEERAVESRIVTVTDTRDRAASDRDQATLELAQLKRGVADARLLANVVDLDFTLVVFNAYYRAARVLATEDPSCAIRWQALAGIGRTESHHGRYSGGMVDADGNLTVAIYGPVLDGSNGTARIKDSDGGELDGLVDIDRAVGPMQFIPTTWVAFARDANGDGRADPQNYYDTNLTAGVYLCRQGPGLEHDDGLRRAFRSYNNDGGYVTTVLRNTHEYDRYVIPPVNGDTAPPLPPPPDEPSTTTTAERPRPDTTSTTVRAPSSTATTTTSTSSVSTSTTVDPSSTTTAIP